MTEPDDPLREWEPQTPPLDFPDRVLAALHRNSENTAENAAENAAEPNPAVPNTAEPNSAIPTTTAQTKPAARRKFTQPAIWAAALVLAASALIWIWRASPDTRGDVIAARRTEQALGRRATAVLEPAAHIRFAGEEVWQEAGRVFYRVSPGSSFTVHTPAFDVTVLGTCFHIELSPDPATTTGDSAMQKALTTAATGTAIGILATVFVYEGRVRLSHSSPNHAGSGPLELQLGPGQTATFDGAGLHLSPDAVDLNGASSNPLELADANVSIVPPTGSVEVSTLQAKIAHVRRQKAALEERLTKTQAELAKYEAAAGEAKKDPYDLDREKWKELAKVGGIMFRAPCPVEPDWRPSAEDLDALDLAPEDADTLVKARQNSSRRLAEVIRPLCLAAVGNETAVSAIDPLTCLHIVADIAHKQDDAKTKEAMRQVAEVNAGLLPEPTPEQMANPVFAGFYTYTHELDRFRAELAESFGPEHAKAIAFGKGCYNVIRHQVGSR